MFLCLWWQPHVFCIYLERWLLVSLEFNAAHMQDTVGSEGRMWRGYPTSFSILKCHLMIDWSYDLYLLHSANPDVPNCLYILLCHLLKSFSKKRSTHASMWTITPLYNLTVELHIANLFQHVSLLQIYTRPSSIHAYTHADTHWIQTWYAWTAGSVYTVSRQFPSRNVKTWCFSFVPPAGGEGRAALP